MTTPIPLPRSKFRGRLTLALAAIALVGAMAPLSGCPSKPPPKPPPPPPPPPPAPKAPDPVTIDAVMQTMGADPRVQFPQAKAPTDEGFARAVISLADAIVRGDSGKLRPMLTPPARAVLSQLEGGEEWSSATGKLEAARVIYAGSSPGGGSITVLALQDQDGAYLLGWAGTKAGDTWVFTNAPTTGAVKSRASEWDSAAVTDLFDSALIGDLAANLPVTPAEGTPEEQPEQPADKPEDPNDPIRKRTPAGPINIPRPPGGG